MHWTEIDYCVYLLQPQRVMERQMEREGPWREMQNGLYVGLANNTLVLCAFFADNQCTRRGSVGPEDAVGISTATDCSSHRE